MTRVGAQRLGFTYGKVPVLADVDVALEPGAVTTLSGPSGSGKSTLLYLLALLLRPASGDVVWDGRPVGRAADGERARLRASLSGFVFQDAMLDPSRTVLDNVLEPALYAGLDRRAAGRRARDLLDELGVGHRADHRPGEVSGGQAQRVALCRALVTDPPVLFCDEPTGNLDRDATEVVWAALGACADRGATVVVATHDLDLVARAGARVVLA
ncbi:ABC transporter ATP-binding protein [Cellulomonas fimi]|uniref:ABC transporter related protein n=1 Tax=Cellulomonas fimi (strain ATCC 484 / DSM 20113 / JCM 1341 / CCUG 24087 / LMG 16345 / NBRC 15513 / NCIMB 8980 / NCTC 7547 / NRS-133) TaxID=590998 RepID=F4H4Q3_CELFA|nr:ATP-binding cassette domain-containing protein [Cellulomonas fimi]AEE44254.1 ABC transporter related protein [Cellulomonas fimi ATCC 484]NNH05701.1 ATP-binding cassette domain-containing protein [Cellulomonas fimi]VEH25978.1 Lipoprotein-releasing system ATP-binding protein LolD [Cellulomonas fimi]